MAYATAQDLITYLGATSQRDTTVLEAFIGRAERIIDVACRRTFAASDATRFYTQHSARITGSLLVLDDDLLSLSQVINGTGEEIPTSGIWLEPLNTPPYGHLRLKSGYVWTFNTDGEIQVTGMWGYAATVPADITQATIRLAAFLYRQKDTSADIDRAMLTGDGVTIMPSALPNDVTMMLASYQRSEVR